MLPFGELQIEQAALGKQRIEEQRIQSKKDGRIGKVGTCIGLMAMGLMGLPKPGTLVPISLFFLAVAMTLVMWCWLAVSSARNDAVTVLTPDECQVVACWMEEFPQVANYVDQVKAQRRELRMVPPPSRGVTCATCWRRFTTTTCRCGTY